MWYGAVPCRVMAYSLYGRTGLQWFDVAAPAGGHAGHADADADADATTNIKYTKGDWPVQVGGTGGK